MTDSQQPDLKDHPILNSDSAPAAPSAETSAGSQVKWAGGKFSMKAYRCRAILLFLLTIAFIIGGFYGVKLFDNALWKKIIWGLAAGIPVILWIQLLVTAWYKSYTIRYKLDEDRLLVQKGLFTQTTDTVLIAQLNDMQLLQTLADKLINGGIGTLKIYTSDKTDPILYLRGLESPMEAFESIDTLRKEYVRRRGIKAFRVSDSEHHDADGDSDCDGNV